MFIKYQECIWNHNEVLNWCLDFCRKVCVCLCLCLSVWGCGGLHAFLSLTAFLCSIGYTLLSSAYLGRLLVKALHIS